ncbi:Uncharacterised protein [Mobiluncus mulieris]|nr:hypothetical protein HMPREF0577_1071 [Mobiluncus mulieris ATCC 35243]MCV0003282.1 hypothetical protein [Mobiluncus mulieris]SPX71267.1 Uncharacterised protein [Mobiluncus mulieris]
MHIDGMWSPRCRVIGASVELAAETGVGEVHLPAVVLGSAMSVNSFMGFASILWAMAINGAILDAYKTNLGVGFSIIFVFMAGVGVVGAALAFWLHRLNRCVGSDGSAAIASVTRVHEVPVGICGVLP